MRFSETDQENLIYAKTLLENPGFAMSVMNTLGIPFEAGLQALPVKWSASIQNISESALFSALNFAVSTLGIQKISGPSKILHKLAAAGSGCAGGVFGMPALAVELPISTTIMLRSVAAIAKSEGEDITRVETKLACMEVFAFGGQTTTEADDSLETAYYAVRAALSKSISEASAYIAEHGISEAGGPVLVKLISEISTRFGITVSEKAAASAIPIIGAAGGALINTIFINHFQNMAYGHFIIRRIERTYGKEMVRAEYERI